MISAINYWLMLQKNLTLIYVKGILAARIGGDEFTVMLANITSNTDLTITVERLFNELSKPVQIKEHLIQISSSMGISLFPKDGNDIQTLLKLADTALYQAKENGRNQFYYYSTELHEEYNRTHGLGKELQQRL